MTRALRNDRARDEGEIAEAQPGNGDIRSSESSYDLMMRFFALAQEVPEEELKRLPKDGALNHDHYLYGAPKK